MPDQRTNQTVAERLELQLERFPNPLHRRRRWLTLAGGLLPLLLLGVFFARGDHTIFLSEPVAESHQHFQDDCQKCHRTPWQPLVRMASADSAARSVRDQDCQQCHVQHKADHNRLALAKGVPDCVACHQEHRGAIRLTDHADTSCVQCHVPFERHPEFALLRPWPMGAETSADTAARRKELEQVAMLPRGDDGAASSSGTWVDKSALKFSHEGHLAPLVAKLSRGTAAANSAQPTQLACADCHELDANGQYMQPIVYEQHCQDCHPLRFSSKLARATAVDSKDFDWSLPHEAPEIVRSVMRDRLIANAPQHLATTSSTATNPGSRLPNSQAAEAQEEWEWVAEELRVLENAIFRKATNDAAAPPGNACLKCHKASVPSTAFDGQSGTTASTFAIAPPNIPRRWMPHSHFSHDRHQNMKCVDCHPVRSVEDGAGTDSSSAQELHANTVEDILMPTLESCRTCHGATSGTGPGIRPARKNCTECHQYHHDHFTQAAHEPASH